MIVVDGERRAVRPRDIVAAEHVQRVVDHTRGEGVEKRLLLLLLTRVVIIARLVRLVLVVEVSLRRWFVAAAVCYGYRLSLSVRRSGRSGGGRGRGGRCGCCV